MRNFIFLLSLSLCLVSCSGGGGNSPSPRVLPDIKSPTYPSISNSVYSLSKPYAKQGEDVLITVKIRDQFGAPLDLSEKWTMGIQITCSDCDEDPTFTIVPTGVATEKSYRITPGASKMLSVFVLFNPTTAYAESQFGRDFPNGIPGDDLYAVGVTIPEYDICTIANSEIFNGLKGKLVIAGIERFAICNANDLKIASTDSYFLDQALYLAKDINLTSYYEGGGTEFAFGLNCPNQTSCTFSGSLFGNGKSIVNFKRTNGLGLFTHVYDGEIKQLTLADTVQSGISGGAIAGIIQGKTRIGDVKVSGSVSGTNTVGGLVGEMEESQITHSASTATVSSKLIAGGLVGFATGNTFESIIYTSSSKGSISVSQTTPGEVAYAGGILGVGEYKVKIADSLFNGQINSINRAGGLAGRYYGVISNSYAYGTIVANEAAGGFIFDSYTQSGVSTIVNSFSSISLNSPTKASIGVDCKSLKLQGVLTLDQASDCIWVNNYTVENLTEAIFTDLQDLVTKAQAIINNWSILNWDKSSTQLPEIKK